MITPITQSKKLDLAGEMIYDPVMATIFLCDKINEIIEHINGEPDEQIERKCDHPDCMLCNECDEPVDRDDLVSTGEKVLHAQVFWKAGFNTEGAFTQEQLNDPKVEKYTILGSAFMPDKLEGVMCKQHEPDEPVDDDRSEMFENLDNTDAAYDPIDTRGYNIKLWTRDMRKMIKNKNISPKLKDDIRRKLNELEEI